MKEKRKKRNMEDQKKLMEIRQLTNANYCYKPSIKTYSKVKCQMHNLGLIESLPGKDALEEVLMFLYTYKPKKKHQYYGLALRVALKKTEGRKYYSLENEKKVISSKEDVEYVMKMCLETAGIYDAVEDLVYSLIGL